MPSFTNDLTPEAQDPRDQATIAFLRRAYVTRDTNMDSETPLDDPHTDAQVIARVRERLITAREESPQRPDLRLITESVSSSGTGYTMREISGEKKKAQSKGFAFVALVAVLTIVLASSFLLFHQAQLNNIVESNQNPHQTSQATSLSEQARTLVKQFHEQAQTWGKAHLYQRPLNAKYPLNGKSYMLDSAYLAPAGIGGELDQQLAGAKSDAAFKKVIEATNKALFHLQMFEAAAADKTPYDAVHQSDIQLMKQYKLQQGTMVIVSTAEQALHVYRDGKLIKAILLTTGRQQSPSLIGVWQIESRQKDITFTSAYPQGTSNWSADTPVQYALSYHTGGYFIYGAWWRADYGPGTQFPHQDMSGNKDFVGVGGPNDGSPGGGIEMPVTQAQWLYEQTSIGTPVIIY